MLPHVHATCSVRHFHCTTRSVSQQRAKDDGRALPDGTCSPYSPLHFARKTYRLKPSHVHDDTFATAIPQNNSIFSSAQMQPFTATFIPQHLDSWQSAASPPTTPFRSSGKQLLRVSSWPTSQKKRGLLCCAIASEVMKFLVAKYQHADPHLLDLLPSMPMIVVCC